MLLVFVFELVQFKMFMKVGGGSLKSLN